MFKTLLSAGVLTPLLAVNAFANDSKILTGSVEFELIQESLYDSSDDPQHLNGVYAEIEAILELHLSKRVFIGTELIFEPTVRPSTSDFQAFKNEGIYAEVLTLNYAADGFGVFAGKFNPNILTGFKQTPDLFDVDYNEDELEITKRLGYGGYFDIDAGRRGTHRISGNMFFVDTTGLSESLITDWGRTKRSDGGVSNTGAPESFFLGLYGGKIAGLKGVTYYVGFTRQATDLLGDDDDIVGDAGDDGSVGDEYRLSGAIQKKFEITKTFSISPLIENYYFWNAEGVAGQERDYLTLAVEIVHRQTSLQLAYTGRFVRGVNGLDRRNYNDAAFEATVAHKFKSGLTLEVDAFYLDEVGEPYWAGETTLSKTFKF